MACECDRMPLGVGALISSLTLPRRVFRNLCDECQFSQFMQSDFCIGIQAVSEKPPSQHKEFYKRLYELTKKASHENIRRAFCIGWTIDEIESVAISDHSLFIAIEFEHLSNRRAFGRLRDLGVSIKPSTRELIPSKPKKPKKRGLKKLGRKRDGN